MKLEAAIPELISLLKDKYGNVRYQAVEALRNLNAKSAIPQLIPLLKDECDEVATVTAKALSELQAEEVGPTLVNLLESNDMFVKQSSLQALAQIKSDKAMIELNQLLQNTSLIVQEIDSVEYGLTDIQEYYGNTGGLKKAAEKQGGKKVKASFVESFSKDTTPRDLDDLLRMEYRTKLLNP